MKVDICGFVRFNTDCLAQSKGKTLDEDRVDAPIQQTRDLPLPRNNGTQIALRQMSVLLLIRMQSSKSKTQDNAGTERCVWGKEERKRQREESKSAGGFFLTFNERIQNP